MRVAFKQLIKNSEVSRVSLQHETIITSRVEGQMEEVLFLCLLRATGETLSNSVAVPLLEPQ